MNMVEGLESLHQMLPRLTSAIPRSFSQAAVCDTQQYCLYTIQCVRSPLLMHVGSLLTGSLPEKDHVGAGLNFHDMLTS